MEELVVKRPRKVIPRWRDFATTAALGELGVIQPEREIIQPPSDFEDIKSNWANHKSAFTAGDLLATALLEGDLAVAFEAAEYLLRPETQAMEFTRAIAEKVVRWAATGQAFPVESPASESVQIFDTRTIGVIRRTLAAFPDSPIHWVELALGYAVIGQQKKALRAILTALALAPNDRFVLRSAVRFFLHQRLPDDAAKVLANARRTVSDPWLLAAHISVADILERAPRFHKHAKSVCEDTGLSPFHRSELAAALATDHIASGNDKKARRLFRQSLESPTENTLAQALWAKDHVVISEADHRLLNLPLSFEANTRVLVSAEKWQPALEAAKAWQNDEPFAARPAVLGSYLAASALEHFPEAETIARRALMANPEDPGLINNLAYSLACQGKVEEAKKALTAQKSDVRPEHSITLTATEGLAHFRSGEFEQGRAKYKEAMLLAEQEGLSTYAACAAIYLSREEVRANPQNAQSAIGTLPAILAGAETSTIRIALANLNSQLRKIGLEEITLPEKAVPIRKVKIPMM